MKQGLKIHKPERNDVLMAHKLIGHQPARVIFLDFSAANLSSQTVMGVLGSLEHTLCLSSSMNGPSRIPLFGIYLLTDYPEVILPLTYTKGNFVRLHSAISDIRGALTTTLSKQQSRSKDPCMASAVAEACRQYKRHLATWTQGSVTFNQLEIIILTGHPGSFVQNQLKSLPEQTDLGVIKRIMSATITSSLLTSPSSSPDEDAMMLDPDCDAFTGLVDILTLETDIISLQKFFYSWLTDVSNEVEHMHLILPPPNTAEDKLVIKCDLAERMLSLPQLPFHEHFSLHAESNICKQVFPPPSKVMGITVSIHKLQVIKIYRRSDICDSVLFGVPLLALPTCCWKTDWDALEKNQQNFVSLCKELLSKDQVLLAKTMNPSLDQDAGAVSNKNNAAPKPVGFFLLIPSENSNGRSFLIKSVLSRDLLLPSSTLISSGISTEESDLKVQASLSEVETGESFNPLSLESGLLSAIKHSSLPRSVVDKVRTNKRKPSHKQAQMKPGPALDSDVDIAIPEKPPVAGSRKIANYWSSPLNDFSNTPVSMASAGMKKKKL